VDPLIFQQPPQQFERGVLVASILHQDVQNLVLVVDGAPQVHPPAADLHHHLVQMPSAGGRRPAPSQVRRDQRAELDYPAAHRFAADLDTALGQQLLDVTDAQREAEVQPHGISDHVRWESVTLERDGLDHDPSGGRPSGISERS
jgi:hypothetical protein